MSCGADQERPTQKEAHSHWLGYTENSGAACRTKSMVQEILRQGGNDIIKVPQCCLMIKHSTCDSHCNMLMSQMKVQSQCELIGIKLQSNNMQMI